MTNQNPSEMDQYAARKNTQFRGGVYMLLIAIAAIAGYVLYVAIDAGTAGTLLVLGLPALIVIAFCLLGIYAVNKQAKQ